MLASLKVVCNVRILLRGVCAQVDFSVNVVIAYIFCTKTEDITAGYISFGLIGIIIAIL